MMMTVRSQRSDRGYFKALFSVAVLAAVLFFGSSAAGYLQSAFTSLFAKKITSLYDGMSRDALIENLLAAEAELSRTRYQAYLYGLVVKENEELRNAATVESFSRAIPARVVARPPRTHYDNLLLDVGAAAGVRENDLVVKDRVALGVIVSVGQSSSQARLFSTPGALQDAVVGEPQAIAVAAGMGGGAFELAIPQGVVVVPGEPVRIPHSDTLILGIVVAFSGKPTDATQTVYVKSPAALSDLDYVSVIPSGL